MQQTRSYFGSSNRANRDNSSRWTPLPRLRSCVPHTLLCYPVPERHSCQQTQSVKSSVCWVIRRETVVGLLLKAWTFPMKSTMQGRMTTSAASCTALVGHGVPTQAGPLGGSYILIVCKNCGTVASYNEELSVYTFIHVVFYVRKHTWAPLKTY